MQQLEAEQERLQPASQVAQHQATGYGTHMRMRGARVRMSMSRSSSVEGCMSRSATWCTMAASTGARGRALHHEGVGAEELSAS